jgi:hypothetical protein
MKKPTRTGKVNKPIKKLTTFRLEAELVRRARRYALDHGTTVTEMIDEALRQRLGLKPEDRK